jgi:hypothetical protein
MLDRRALLHVSVLALCAAPSGCSKAPTLARDGAHGGESSHAEDIAPSPPPSAGVAESGKNVHGGAPTGTDCSSPNLVWRRANKTNYTSYPAPDSPECIQYNGCAYEGQFTACGKKTKKSLRWVKAHNIVSVFPNLEKASGGIPALSLHDLCLRSGSRTILVTALDECADSDCSGCCTQNKGNADELVDVESFTDARWGVQDGPIEWADLGPTKGTGCQ